MGDPSATYNNLGEAGPPDLSDVYKNVESIYEGLPLLDKSPLQHPRWLKMFGDIACLDI
jgi:hypothetical protein